MILPARTAAVLIAAACCAPATAVAPPAAALGRMPLTGLAPARLVPGLCVLKYRVSTSSPECQAFFDQGLGYFYSYVWMEAARSFETAVRQDPNCALAWWGLSRALDRWGRPGTGKAATQALRKADALRGRASHREQLLIQARVQEKGLDAGAGDPAGRKRAATKTIDTLLSLYDDDEEGWYYRAQLAGGQHLFGGEVSSAPFYKALARINPLHPGATHELLHFYEKCQRPALGWAYAEAYIQSSPGIPHPFHMQAHLATRLGRWDKTSDRSTHAVALERAYHHDMHVAPKDDPQFSHHLEILTLSLIHDGRFREARAAEAEARAAGFSHWLPWFRLALAEGCWADAERVVEHYRKDNKTTASYLAAVLCLRRGELTRARAEVEVLRQAAHDNKNDSQLQFRLWETQGLLMCRTGDAAAGLKLLAKASDRSKSDYSHHAWGNGAYYMEIWGAEALRAGADAEAEEALLEALAHDPGSVRAALGLQVLCERQGRAEEAARYAALARRDWRHAEPADLAAQLASLRAKNPPPTTQKARANGDQRQRTSAGAPAGAATVRRDARR